MKITKAGTFEMNEEGKKTKGSDTKYTGGKKKRKRQKKISDSIRDKGKADG